MKLVHVMRKLSLLPFGALLLGAAGAVLRRLQLTTAFDPYSGLPKSDSGLSALLLALVIAALALFAAAAVFVSLKLDAPGSFRKSFYTGSYAAFALRAVLGLAVSVIAIVCVISGADLMALTGVSRWVFALLLFLSGVGMTSMAYYSYTQRREKPFLKLFSVIPPLFYCYFMVALYRLNAGNPVLLDFCYGCMAFAAAALSFYYAAGYAYGRKNMAGTVFTSLASVFLMTLTLADSYTLPLKLVIAAGAVYLADSTARFLSATTPKPKREPEEK